MHVRPPDPVRDSSPRVTRLLGGAVTGTDAARAARARSPIERWAAAVALGGFGHYAAAAAVLERLRGERAAGPVLRAHATLTWASHLRQAGGHAAAAVLDGRALAGLAGVLAGGIEPARGWGLDARAAVADALTGLAADALGRFDAGTAAVLLGRADPWCGPPDTRCRIRYGWVRAETALVAGDPAAAVAAADAALIGARLLGSARHVLKSRLVRAVAGGVAGERPRGVLAELGAVAAAATASGHRPLHRPALRAAADLRAATGTR